MTAVRAANSGKPFLQIATLEKGCHGSLDHRAPETVLALKPFIVDLTERVKMLVDQTPQFGCMRIVDHRSALVPVGTIRAVWHTRQPWENDLSGSQVGNRQSPGPSIPSMVDRPMATAWKYARHEVYARTRLVPQKLLLATPGCKPLGSLWIRSGVLLPRTVSRGGKLVSYGDSE